MSSFEESPVLEVDAGQTFLEGYTFSPGYTLVSEEWPRVGSGPDSYFSRADSFSLGYTLFSVRGMAQGGEWSGQLLLEGRLILSRLHLVWCQRNGPGWGVV